MRIRLETRLQWLEERADVVLQESGITATDPWTAIDQVPSKDRCVYAAAYLKLRAHMVRVHLEAGKSEDACLAAMDVEQQWHDMATLYNVEAYGRKLQLDTTLARDMNIGARRRASIHDVRLKGSEKNKTEALKRREALRDFAKEYFRHHPSATLPQVRSAARKSAVSAYANHYSDQSLEKLMQGTKKEA